VIDCGGDRASDRTTDGACRSAVGRTVVASSGGRRAVRGAAAPAGGRHATACGTACGGARGRTRHCPRDDRGRGLTIRPAALPVRAVIIVIVVRPIVIIVLVGIAAVVIAFVRAAAVTIAAIIVAAATTTAGATAARAPRDDMSVAVFVAVGGDTADVIPVPIAADDNATAVAIGVAGDACTVTAATDPSGTRRTAPITAIGVAGCLVAVPDISTAGFRRAQARAAARQSGAKLVRPHTLIPHPLAGAALRTESASRLTDIRPPPPLLPPPWGAGALQKEPGEPFARHPPAPSGLRRLLGAAGDYHATVLRPPCRHEGSVEHRPRQGPETGRLCVG